MQVTEVIPKSCTLGNPFAVHGLGVVPILCDTTPELAELDLLETALTGGALKITEVGEGGAVPFLRAENDGSKPVLILDGEELVGGKQNRVVNATIIILPGKVMDIPVSCMEAGRWNRQRADFESGEAIFRAKSRALKNLSVASSLRREGTYRSDQGAVWDEVASSLHEYNCESPTSDFRESRAKVAHQIDSFVKAITAADRQIGAVFISGKGVLGLELVADPDLLSRCFPKIIRSFAFDVLQDEDLSGVSGALAAQWWEKIKGAAFSRHSSPGAGEDLRVEAGDLIGSGLLWNDRLVHFSCFPGYGPAGEFAPGRAGASERRRRGSSYARRSL